MTGFSASTRIHATLLAFGHRCPCSCTVATEIGETARVATLTKLASYTGLCPV
jgi:hypothetical protein